MPLFKVRENRFINTEHVADISYTPMIRLGVQPGADAASGPPPLPSNLNILLRSTEVIMLEGDEADAAWLDFQEVHRKPDASDSAGGGRQHY